MTKKSKNDEEENVPKPQDRYQENCLPSAPWAMLSTCRGCLVLSRLNIFCVYVLIAITALMIITEISLLSTFQFNGEKLWGSPLVKIFKENKSSIINMEGYQIIISAKEVNSTDYDEESYVTLDTNYGMTSDEMVTSSTVANENYDIFKFLNVKENTQLLHRIKEVINETRKHRKTRPTILLWTAEEYGNPPDVPKIPICGGGCVTTKNRKHINRSDAVVFSMKGMHMEDVPNAKWRRSNQVYVWWSQENPWTSLNFYQKKLDEIEDNYFNWTMTFRRDSDVNAMMIPYSARDYVTRNFRRYEKSHPRAKHYDSPQLPYPDPPTPRPWKEKEIFVLKRQASRHIRRKTKIAVWVASNCGYTSGAYIRKKLVMNMIDLGLPIDIYGQCGNKTVPQTLGEFADLLSGYKFYLAFENAFHCREYITEKFWYNGLHAGVVPVIWGPRNSDVEAVAPPHSFIHYDDFKSHSKLVEYLLHLSENDDLYLKYFAWWWKVDGHFPVRGVTEVESENSDVEAIYNFEINAYCHLCSLLNNGMHKKFKKSYRSLYEWWYRGEDKVCLDLKHGAPIPWPLPSK